MTFTRLYYSVCDVKLNIIGSLLNNNPNAIYWAFELFDSGFTKEVMELLIKIYYYFYASLNPTFENYIYTKLWNEYFDKSDYCMRKSILNLFITNLLSRPFNYDVFILLNYARQTQKQSSDFKKEKIQEYVLNENYLCLSKFILNEMTNEDVIDEKNETINFIYDEFMNNHGFSLNKSTILKNIRKISKKFPFIERNVILLTKVLYLFSKINKLKLGNSIYTEENIGFNDLNNKITEILKDETIRGWKKLPLCIKYKTNEYNFRELFKNLPYKKPICELWSPEVFYYECLTTPIWTNRIAEFGGNIKSDKYVIFKNDDVSEEFYSKYWYDPEEQKREIHDMIWGRQVVDDVDVGVDWKRNSLITEQNEVFQKFDYKLL